MRYSKRRADSAAIAYNAGNIWIELLLFTFLSMLGSFIIYGYVS